MSIPPQNQFPWVPPLSQPNPYPQQPYLGQPQPGQVPGPQYAQAVQPTGLPQIYRVDDQLLAQAQAEAVKEQQRLARAAAGGGNSRFLTWPPHQAGAAT